MEYSNKSIYRMLKEHYKEMYPSDKKKYSAENIANEVHISPDRLRDIGKNAIVPNPDEVVALAKFFKRPRLCAAYCHHDCHIGQYLDMPERDALKDANLSEIVLNLLFSLNKIKKLSEAGIDQRLIDISHDGVITEDERPDFDKLKDTLKELSDVYQALSLWDMEESLKE